ncbi:MAG: hypothetical protein BGN85_11465 [Alphaproteobacteria bacterium 64-11]|nr:hypothetical protein [Alphaproteobacteria bacterium]OJU08112.1 MAG: hypothetical protein BGN85_11465 [Alphaproteobacteria bacterium 64-11]
MTHVSPILSGKGLHIVESREDDDRIDRSDADKDISEQLTAPLSLRVSLLIWLVLTFLGWLALALLLRLM